MEQSVKTFCQYYPKLVRVLPAKDSIFAAELKSHGLLPGDMKEKIQSYKTRSDAVTFFLDHNIGPKVSNGDNDSLHELLDVMEGYMDDSLKNLAREIRSQLPKKNLVRAGSARITGMEPPTKKANMLESTNSMLKGRYIRDLSSDNDSSKMYIQLALVENEKIKKADKNLEEFTKLTLQGQLDELLQRKVPLNDLRDIFHYQNKPCPRLILILGGPGIGKTTLANQICLRWAKDEFLCENFDTVILIPLRTVHKLSLEEIMIEHIGEDACHHLKKQLGRRCLLILEGLDEMGTECRQTDQMFQSLINNEIMLEVTLLITSRPQACQELKSNRTIEVIGFSKKKIAEYVKKTFHDDGQSKDIFLGLLEKYPHVSSLCYVPLSLKIILEIFQHMEEKLPLTITELYRCFIVMKFQNQNEKTKDTKMQVVPHAFMPDPVKSILCKMLEDIPEQAIDTVYLLSKLAYFAFFDNTWCTVREERKGRLFEKAQYIDPKIIFNDNDLIQSGIALPQESDGFGLLKCSNVKRLTKSIITYNFLHLTVQEFFCSLYIAITMSPEEQCHFMQKHFDSLLNIMLLVSGLTGLESLNCFQFIYSKLSSGTTFGNNEGVLGAVKCIYESQKDTLPEQALSPVKMILSDITLQPYDLLCTSYTLCHYPIVELKVRGCCIEDSGIRMLAKYCAIKETKLEQLNISDNQITSDGIKHVVIILKSSTLLQKLDISKNEIGDDGVGLICEELKSNKTLSDLSVFSCGLSLQGTVYMRALLMENKTLKSLNISHNKLCFQGLSFLIDGFENNNSLNEIITNDLQEGVMLRKDLIRIYKALKHEVRTNQEQASGQESDSDDSDLDDYS